MTVVCSICEEAPATHQCENCQRDFCGMCADGTYCIICAERHSTGCICADCSGADLTADNNQR